MLMVPLCACLIIIFSALNLTGATVDVLPDASLPQPQQSLVISPSKYDCALAPSPANIEAQQRPLTSAEVINFIESAIAPGGDLQPQITHTGLQKSISELPGAIKEEVVRHFVAKQESIVQYLEQLKPREQMKIFTQIRERYRNRKEELSEAIRALQGQQSDITQSLKDAETLLIYETYLRTAQPKTKPTRIIGLTSKVIRHSQAAKLLTNRSSRALQEQRIKAAEKKYCTYLHQFWVLEKKINLTKQALQQEETNYATVLGQYRTIDSLTQCCRFTFADEAVCLGLIGVPSEAVPPEYIAELYLRRTQALPRARIHDFFYRDLRELALKSGHTKVALHAAQASLDYYAKRHASDEWIKVQPEDVTTTLSIFALHPELAEKSIAVANTFVRHGAIKEERSHALFFGNLHEPLRHPFSQVINKGIIQLAADQGLLDTALDGFVYNYAFLINKRYTFGTKEHDHVERIIAFLNGFYNTTPAADEAAETKRKIHLYKLQSVSTFVAKYARSRLSFTDDTLRQLCRDDETGTLLDTIIDNGSCTMDQITSLRQHAAQLQLLRSDSIAADYIELLRRCLQPDSAIQSEVIATPAAIAPLIIPPHIRRSAN